MRTIPSSGEFIYINTASVYIQGTNAGYLTVYDFQIDCVYSCWIQQIKMERGGTAIPLIELWEGNKSSLICYATYDTSNMLYTQYVNMTQQEYYAKQFRLIEYDTVCCWRYRANYTINATTNKVTIWYEPMKNTDFSQWQLESNSNSPCLKNKNK
eukprot:162440_1